jgi:hypothetical protein
MGPDRRVAALRYSLALCITPHCHKTFTMLL